MENIVDGCAAQDSFIKRFNDLLVFLYRDGYQTSEGSAVILIDNDVLRNIDQPACKITGVGCLEGGIGP